MSIISIVLGVAVIGCSRVFADHFCFRNVPENMQNFVNWLGIADNYISQLTRWCVAVFTGLGFILAGIITLAD